ncbi:MAG: GNAT family N-acetyltransferase [Patescibacteria group bacterium]
MNKRRIQIRLAIRGDERGIIDVVEGTFPQDFNYGKGFDREKCRRFFRTALNDENEIVIVAKQGDKIIGFIHYENKPPTNGTVYLNMIGISKNMQGQGIGIKLLIKGDKLAVRYIKEVCGIPNLATIYLSTSKDNPVGQRLYLKAGYIHVGNIPGLVGKGNIELVMLKKVGDVKYKTGLWAKKRKE